MNVYLKKIGEEELLLADRLHRNFVNE